MTRLSVEYPYMSLMTEKCQENVLNERQMYFSEIKNMYPYGGEKPVITISDLDGVFFEFGKNDSWEQNIKRLRALGDIAKKSEEIVFWTGRTESENLSFFPFISRDKISRFKKYLNTANPECKVSFKCGLSKITNGNGFDELISKNIAKGNEVVVIGSSLVDRKKVNQAKDAGKNVHYFDTGHLII
jgi:hypothetical protein